MQHRWLTAMFWACIAMTIIVNIMSPSYLLIGLSILAAIAYTYYRITHRINQSGELQARLDAFGTQRLNTQIIYFLGTSSSVTVALWVYQIAMVYHLGSLYQVSAITLLGLSAISYVWATVRLGLSLRYLLVTDRSTSLIRQLDKRQSKS